MNQLSVIASLILLRSTWAYKAAYVEHQAASPCGQGVCGEKTLALNAETYATYAATAASQGTQVIVFPEYGLTGFSSYSKKSWISGGYTEVIPELSSTPVVPCESDADFGATLVTLSCAAKDNGIAILANLVDEDGDNIYNTDVAFDTDGTYLGKYHKVNLWGETNMDTPQDCPEASFKTSFGVEFGVITCADLIYEYPAVALVERNITNFLVPVAWDDSMAQMQVLGWAQAFSLRFSVNVVMCNHRSGGESGSGIWSSGQVLSYQFDPNSANGAGSVMVADVSGGEGASLSSASQISRVTGQVQRNTTGAIVPHAASSWSYTSLTENGEVCSGQVCCTASNIEGSTAGYAIAALDGTDTSEGLTWGARVCAILPCTLSVGESSQRSCLNYQKRPSSALTAVTLEMTRAQADYIFPEIIASDSATANSQTLLTPVEGDSVEDGEFFFYDDEEAGKASVQLEYSGGVTSVTMYGRKYDEDDLSYACP